MNKKLIWALAATLVCGTLTSCSNDNEPVVNPPVEEDVTLSCVKPDYLMAGDKVALISPSYFTPMENVEKTADVLRSWGLEPVVGPNVGKVVDGRYAGTVAERVSDIRWALDDPNIKAIICNRGGYGTIQLIDQLTLTEWGQHPKWLCGFPGGHGDVNLPLVMGAPVTIDVRTDGATLQFDIDGEQQSVSTADITAPATPAAARLRMAGKRE